MQHAHKNVGDEALCMAQRFINEYGDSEESETLYGIAIKATNCMSDKEHRKTNTQSKSQGRCKWWNGGYCREGSGCTHSHQAGDCEQHLLGGSNSQGCSQRHRRRCKHWVSAAGCYRADQCQYLHLEKVADKAKKSEAENVKIMKNQEIQTEADEDNIMKLEDKEAQTENTNVTSRGIQTESHEMKSIQQTKKSAEQDCKKVRITEKFIILTLPRGDLDDEQWEDFKWHAQESGMNIDEFLDEMPKVVEGYIRLEDDKICHYNKIA